MKQYKNFIIYGPGRTGSQWTESLLIGLLDAKSWRHNSFSLFSDCWICQTNDIDVLLGIPRKIRDSITLFVCDRSNAFERTISYVVAKETNEFFFYTDKTIVPIKVDPTYFKEELDNYQCTLDKFNRTVVPLYNSIVRIDYDALSAAAVPEHYIADQLGVNYRLNLDYHHISIKNTRDYKKVILNWEELHQLYQEWLVDQ
jgi:hypothetical protein